MDSGVAAPPRLLSFGGKSGNPRRIHRLKTTGTPGELAEGAASNRSEDDIGGEIHRLMETLDRCNGLALEDEVVANGLHAEHPNAAPSPIVCARTRHPGKHPVAEFVKRRRKLAAQLIHKNNPPFCSERAFNLCLPRDTSVNLWSGPPPDFSPGLGPCASF
jgi:hypothetical protein